MSLKPGLRVVRGPDWHWGEQDGGKGHVGTVIALGKAGSSTPQDTVNVRWDRGLRADYRMGFNDAFDLLVLDNGPAGDTHEGVQCDECQQDPIRGIRWNCAPCYNYDLCSSCYHSVRHNSTHQFYRIIIAGAKRVLVPRRELSPLFEIKGLFPGAKVSKGADFARSDQDVDGNKFQGTIFSLCEWEYGYGNSGAVVDWPPYGRDTYRLGFKGKVDLKTKQPGSGGFCYLGHLPVLEKSIEMESLGGLAVGDHVIILLEEEILKQMQTGHGDWIHEMAQDIGHVGVIRTLTTEQDIMVEYPLRKRKWIFHPAALTKVEKFSLGDSVSITADIINMMKQTACGGWNDQLQRSVGKLATIIEAEEDGSYSIRLNENGQEIQRVSPVALRNAGEIHVETGHKDEMMPASGDSQGFTREISKRIGLEEGKNSDNVAVRAAQGSCQAVQELLRKHPEWVNAKRDEKSALQLAAHGGHMDVVRLLVEAGADIDMKDEDGDTALMYAVYGNEPGIADYLLDQGANVNTMNNEKRTGLHIAVSRNLSKCAQILLNHRCDVNIQDNFGDTALHDAIKEEYRGLVDILIDHEATDFHLTNHRQFNTPQWAALRGNTHAINKLVTKDPRLAGIANVDGFTPLHVAAMNNLPDIVRILIVKGECDVNAFNRDHHTPLLLATGSGHTEVVEVLLTLNADVNLADEDGDTSLHVALLRQVIFPEVPATIPLQKIQARISDKTVATSGLALACLLVEYRADLNQLNNKGQTPLDLVPDARIYQVLQQFIPERRLQRPGGVPRETIRIAAVLNNPGGHLVQGVPAAKPTPVTHQEPECVPHHTIPRKQARDIPEPLKIPPPQRAQQPSPEPAADSLAPNLARCRMGCRRVADCQFMPCGHINVCTECSECFKKCYDCRINIQHTKQLSRELSVCTNPKLEEWNQQRKEDTADAVAKMPESECELSKSVLIQKNRKLEEVLECQICMAQKREYALMCGHVLCRECAETVEECPFCRKPVSKKIKLYM